MTNDKALQNLAIMGGPKTRARPWPGRGLIGQEEKAAVDALFDQAIQSGNAPGYNGAEEDAYCQEFARYMGGGYADGVNSGTTAVYVALRALNLEPYTEVVVSPIIDPGGIMPIVLLNCIPIVADAAPGRYNTGPEQIEAMITQRTSAILISHIGGEPADIRGICAIARKRGIPVVEDCSQAHGARLRGRLVGAFGDIAAFSTMFGKHHCTGGQGGLVFTKKKSLYWTTRRVADRGKPFGLPNDATNCVASLNFNMSEFAAVIGRAQLKKLPSIVQRRRAFVARLQRGLRRLQSIIIPPQVSSAEPSYWWWRLRVNTDKLTCDKETYCKTLAAEGVMLTPTYKAMPHTYEWFNQKRVFGTSGLPWTSPLYKGNPDQQFPCPNAKAAIASHFNLVTYESWGASEAKDILTAISKVEKAYLKH